MFKSHARHHNTVARQYEGKVNDECNLLSLKRIMITNFNSWMVYNQKLISDIYSLIRFILILSYLQFFLFFSFFFLVCNLQFFLYSHLSFAMCLALVKNFFVLFSTAVLKIKGACFHYSSRIRLTIRLTSPSQHPLLFGRFAFEPEEVDTW